MRRTSRRPAEQFLVMLMAGTFDSAPGRFHLAARAGALAATCCKGLARRLGRTMTTATLLPGTRAIQLRTAMLRPAGPTAFPPELQPSETRHTCQRARPRHLPTAPGNHPMRRVEPALSRTHLAVTGRDGLGRRAVATTWPLGESRRSEQDQESKYGQRPSKVEHDGLSTETVPKILPRHPRKPHEISRRICEFRRVNRVVGNS